MPKTGQHNFHVPLPADLYQDLKEASERLERPATMIAREAVAAWLEDHRRQVLADEMAAYAAAVAGTDADLDEALEQAAIQQLNSSPA